MNLLFISFFSVFLLSGYSATVSVVVCDPCAVQLSTNVVGFDIFHFNYCTFNQHRMLYGLCVATVGVPWDVCVAAVVCTNWEKYNKRMNDNNNSLESRQD